MNLFVSTIDKGLNTIFGSEVKDLQEKNKSKENLKDLETVAETILSLAIPIFFGAMSGFLLPVAAFAIGFASNLFFDAYEDKIKNIKPEELIIITENKKVEKTENEIKNKTEENSNTKEDNNNVDNGSKENIETEENKEVKKEEAPKEANPDGLKTFHRIVLLLDRYKLLLCTIAIPVAVFLPLSFIAIPLAVRAGFIAKAYLPFEFQVKYKQK